jgi:site-specific DNA-methyltransferase (adenine-specific)
MWAEKRLQIADTDKTIQGYSDGVFWERNTLALQQKLSKKTDAKTTSRKSKSSTDFDSEELPLFA